MMKIWLTTEELLNHRCAPLLSYSPFQNGYLGVSPSFKSNTPKLTTGRSPDHHFWAQHSFMGIFFFVSSAFLTRHSLIHLINLIHLVDFQTRLAFLHVNWHHFMSFHAMSVWGLDFRSPLFSSSSPSSFFAAAFDSLAMPMLVIENTWTPSLPIWCTYIQEANYPTIEWKSTILLIIFAHHIPVIPP